jgi:hypothetical protein
MATYTKRPLSGSTNGQPWSVAGDSSLGGTVHTGVSGTADWDEVWLWANNTNTSTILLTLEWGGTVVPDNLIQVNVPAQQGLVLVAPGLLIQNSLDVTVYAATVDKINLVGFVNRITS